MANKPESKRIAPWVWIFNLGLALAFIYFLYYLQSVPKTPDTLSRQGQKATSQTAKTGPENIKQNGASKKKDSDFSFYEMLPETKIEAPKVKEYQPKKQPENVNYLLQTGSFRNFTDAERQRANIAFRGLKAEVKQIKLAEDNIWYRVQIGPYTSRSKMNSAIDRLVSINIQPLVKKQILDTDKEHL